MRLSFSKGNRSLILAAFVAGILVAVAWSAYGGSAPFFAAPPRSASLPPENAYAPARSAPAYSFEENSPPVRLVIPAIKIDAKVEPVGITADGTMDVAHSYTDVGWYKYGPPPGAAGNAVIEGHLDTRVSPYAVFYYLYELKPGDEVGVIDAQGRTVRFSVTGSALYPYAAPTEKIFGASNESHLNLVTCDGTWIAAKHSYDERLVVFTKRIE